MDRLSSVAYGLAPGDYVDVMATFLIYEIDEEFQTLLRKQRLFVLQPVSQARKMRRGEAEDGGDRAVWPLRDVAQQRSRR
jgi:hypothetical protein